MSDATDRPPFRADHVGSLLRPRRAARGARAGGERRDRPARAARGRGRVHTRSRGAAGVGRAAEHHRRRVPARLVAHRFPARLRRRRRRAERDLRRASFGRGRAAAVHAGDAQDPAHEAEHARPLQLPEVGHHAHAQVLHAVARDAARARRPRGAEEGPIPTSTSSGPISRRPTARRSPISTPPAAATSRSTTRRSR